jgi:hypothetical protein
VEGHSLRCRSLHVAMQMGPSHRPQVEGVWRMVSEDSRYLSGPFLLIVRTRRIVTDGKTLPTSSAGYSEFPAYGQMRTAPLPTRGAADFYLRTVIVTAAVYRGLDSRLRPKANLSS